MEAGLGSWEVAPKLKPCIGIGQGKMVSDPGRKRWPVKGAEMSSIWMDVNYDWNNGDK